MNFLEKLGITFGSIGVIIVFGSILAPFINGSNSIMSNSTIVATFCAYGAISWLVGLFLLGLGHNKKD